MAWDGNHKPEIKKDSLDCPSGGSHNECMKNNEPEISGAINKGVSLRHGYHPYEGRQECVEILFKGYSSTQIIVIDMETAEELKKQLEFLL